MALLMVIIFFFIYIFTDDPFSERAWFKLHFGSVCPSTFILRITFHFSLLTNKTQEEVDNL